jgi:hypothetical protein
MSQILGAFGLLDFTVYGPFLLGAHFEALGGRGKLLITETADTGHDCICEF